MPMHMAVIERLILVRHAVSTANLDPSVYLQVSDHRIPLVQPSTDAGAIGAGERIRGLNLDVASVCVWNSPYLRCVQTLEIVTRIAFGERTTELLQRESFLLREQEFGDWDGLSETQIEARDPLLYEKRRKLSDEYGRFYFRYPNGESRADVVQRVALFLGKVQRSSHSTHLIFLHGVTQRAFRMVWMNHSVDWFEHAPNPENASVHIIERSEAGTWCERTL
jgi:2,3-bisphosphoglycerate-dependent phosphoglycerate mutase